MEKKQLLFAVGMCGLAWCAAAEEANGQQNGPDLPPPVPNADLSELSGGASPTAIAVTNQTLSALNSGNSVNASSVVTGDVSIQANAFSGFNGVGNFVFNTGNNNNLQGSLSITILTPPTK